MRAHHIEQRQQHVGDAARLLDATMEEIRVLVTARRGGKLQRPRLRRRDDGRRPGVAIGELEGTGRHALLAQEEDSGNGLAAGQRPAVAGAIIYQGSGLPQPRAA
ncbi:MAG TPA: hypothetical protein PKC26_12575, partial [Plasticicumulans sp.]|nr:hypothetical protein [Plasticicumulans sp.]